MADSTSSHGSTSGTRICEKEVETSKYVNHILNKESGVGKLETESHDLGKYFTAYWAPQVLILGTLS